MFINYVNYIPLPTQTFQAVIHSLFYIPRAFSAKPEVVFLRSAASTSLITAFRTFVRTLSAAFVVICIARAGCARGQRAKQKNKRFTHSHGGANYQPIQ